MNTNQRFERSTSSLTCPKCGNEMLVTSTSHITATNELIEIGYSCSAINCLYQYTVKPTKEEQYKFRLDNVLKYMHKVSSDEYVYRRELEYTNYWFTYSKELKQFFFGNTYTPMSLEWVEITLRDLGVMK